MMVDADLTITPIRTAGLGTRLMWCPMVASASWSTGNATWIASRRCWMAPAPTFASWWNNGDAGDVGIRKPVWKIEAEPQRRRL